MWESTQNERDVCLMELKGGLCGLDLFWRRCAAVLGRVYEAAACMAPTLCKLHTGKMSFSGYTSLPMKTVKL